MTEPSLSELVLSNEKTIRRGFFVGIPGAMAAWKIAATRRQLAASGLRSRIGNPGIVFLNTLVPRLLFPVAAAGVAILASQQGWGLFNYFAVPAWQAVAISIFALDFYLSAARRVPSRAGVVAAAPHATRCLGFEVTSRAVSIRPRSFSPC